MNTDFLTALNETVAEGDKLAKAYDNFDEFQDDIKECNDNIEEAVQKKENAVAFSTENGKKEVPIGKSEKEEGTKEENVENKKVRSADKHFAKMPKHRFAKPVEQENIISKIIMLIIGCIVVGVFLGIKANSYYVFTNGKVSALGCCFQWLMQDAMPTITSPLNLSIFFTGFGIGAGVIGLVGLFIALDSSEKKRSRVGHEHGNSRLATNKDFKSYQNRFMER